MTFWRRKTRTGTTPSETTCAPMPVARQAPGGPSLRRLPPHSLAVPGTGTPGPLSAPRRHRRRGGQSPGTGRGHQGTGRNRAAPEEAAREIDDAIAQLEKRSHAKHRLSDSQEDARFCRVSESTLRDRLNRLAAKGQVGLHVPNCELFGGRSKYNEAGFVGPRGL